MINFGKKGRIYSILITCLVSIAVLAYVKSALISKTNSSNRTDEKNYKNKEEVQVNKINNQDMTNTIRQEEFPAIEPLIPEIKKEMLKYEFWTSQLENPGNVIMDRASINKFNEDIRKKTNKVFSLDKYKDVILKNELTGFLKEYKLPSINMYNEDGKILTKDFIDTLSKNINLSDIKDSNEIKYGMSLKKTSVRSFPTEIGVYNSKESIEFDRLQETGLEPCEAVIILHQSQDKKWYFIQMYNYRGWVKANDIALANNKNQVFDYVNSNNFIIVTGNHISIDNNVDVSINNTFNMGDRLTLVDSGELYDKYNKTHYIVKIPIRSNDNLLDFKEALILKNKDVVKDYLSYTRENIIKQAFKLQGDKYDWGNKFNGRDCSSFVTSVFKTFGFLLPRNTDEQEKSFGKQFKFTLNDNNEDRRKVLDNVKPGATIFMPGHEMLYLGKVNGVYYIIHDFTSYGKKEGDKYIYSPVFSVNVTSTMLTLSSGVPYMDRFTSVIQLEN
jgi:hypothetical protein